MTRNDWIGEAVRISGNAANRAGHDFKDRRHIYFRVAC